MLGDVIALLDLVLKSKDKFDTKSALFSWDGSRLEGDTEIVVKKIKTNNEKIWYFLVNELKDYEFVYMPVIPSVYVDNGVLKDEINPDARLFRFVGNPMAKFTTGGEPNLKANFIVVGYKPKSILQKKELK